MEVGGPSPMELSDALKKKNSYVELEEEDSIWTGDGYWTMEISVLKFTFSCHSIIQL